MSEIESAYKESYKRNKDMLTFYQALIDNYDGLDESDESARSYKMLWTILENDINIYCVREERTLMM